MRRPAAGGASDSLLLRRGGRFVEGAVIREGRSIIDFLRRRSACSIHYQFPVIMDDRPSIIKKPVVYDLAAYYDMKNRKMMLTEPSDERLTAIKL